MVILHIVAEVVLVGVPRPNDRAVLALLDHEVVTPSAINGLGLAIEEAVSLLIATRPAPRETASSMLAKLTIHRDLVARRPLHRVVRSIDGFTVLILAGGRFHPMMFKS